MDKRVIAVGLALLAAAGVLLFMRMYSMRYVSTLEYDSAAVTDLQLLSALQQGEAQTGDTVWLTQFGADEEVYRRGDNYYIGVDYTQILADVPLYVDSGDYLLLLAGQGTMIMEDWSEEVPAAGSYISNGVVTNFDGSETGDDTVLFLRLGSGIFINTKSLYINNSIEELTIPSNSILYITEEGIYYYARVNQEKLLYGSLAVTSDSMTLINGMEMTWEELCYNLGLLTEEEPEAATSEETTEAESTEEPESATNEAESGEGSGSGESAEADSETVEAGAGESLEESAGTEEGSGAAGETGDESDGEGDGKEETDAAESEDETSSDAGDGSDAGSSSSSSGSSAGGSSSGSNSGSSTGSSTGSDSGSRAANSSSGARGGSRTETRSGSEG
ncbi:MAG: hypothetical protein LUE63_08880, partial [Lachnospiraceae bacterium]|nr:hypothetical protein [Lachnospiraceae bacterium]